MHMFRDLTCAWDALIIKGKRSEGALQYCNDIITEILFPGIIYRE